MEEEVAEKMATSVATGNIATTDAGWYLILRTRFYIKQVSDCG